MGMAVRALCDSMPDFTDESPLQQCAYGDIFVSKVQLRGAQSATLVLVSKYDGSLRLFFLCRVSVAAGENHSKPLGFLPLAL